MRKKATSDAINMHNRKIAHAILCVLFVATFAKAFNPSQSLLARSKSQYDGSFHRLATKNYEKATMSKEDEEILFSPSSNPDPPYRARHRHKSRTGNLLVDANQPINPLDHSPNDPLINKLRTIRDTLNSCPGIWSSLAKICPEKTAIIDEHLCDEKMKATFGEMDDIIRRSATIFVRLGVAKGDTVAVLGENSARWLMADHGIQLAGGASAVRGADAPLDELRYIYEHSESKPIAVLQGPNLLKKLVKDAKAKNLPGIGLSNEKNGSVKHIILLNSEKKSLEEIQSLASEPALSGIQVNRLSDLLASAEPMSDYDIPTLYREDLSTIVYTSGTTGRPKGVMLSHGNLIHQLGHRLAPTKPYEESEPLPGETMLSLLPVWHITERTFELWMFTRGCNVVYSSIRTFKNDLAKHQPEWMVLVPRVLEKVASGVQAKFAEGSAVVKTLVKIFTATGMARNEHSQIVKGLVVGDSPPGFLKKLKSRLILASLFPLNAAGDKLVWSKVKAGFGGKQKAIISGGSALAGALESFYQMCGIPILVGYGLTECSPLISYRRADSNLITAGCVGVSCLDTEMRVVDPDAKPEFGERKSLPDGIAGVVIGRGPQVMQGYYKNVEATDKAIDQYGWFDTGDLGRINPATGDLILTGRIKDTIVLSNGENIEPSPIEDAILSESSLIEQVMLCGQDGKSLAAITVLSPDELINMGFVDKKLGKKLQKASDTVNDPKCSSEDCETACQFLHEATMDLRKNNDLENALKADTKKATATFRPWERVGEIFITLEPFAMANSQLTQSYKVKRDAVAKRYSDLL